MSRYARAGKNANSAVLVNVDPTDFGSSDVLAGVQLQREIEQAAFRVSAEHGGSPTKRQASAWGVFGWPAPVKGAKPAPTYARGVIEAPIAECFPSFVSESLAQALLCWDES